MCKKKSECDLFFEFYLADHRQLNAGNFLLKETHPVFFIYALRNLLYNIECVYNLSIKGE